MLIDEKDLKDIQDDLLFLISEKDDAKLRNILLSMHPSDIAEMITDFSDEEARLYLFNLLTPEVASEVIIELDDVTREKLVDQLGNRRLTDLVNEMDSDDATDFISDLSEDIAEDVLEQAEEEGADEVRQLLEHEEDTAGGIMALEIVSVHIDSTVDEAIQEIRNKAEDVEDIYHVYVVDDRERLVGTVTLKDLILAPGDKRISEIMDRSVLAVPVSMDQEEVANFAKKYDLVAVPVVDLHGKLLGRITIDDIVDVLEEEATEDIQKMAGLTDEEEVRETSVIRIVQGRFPWLLTALFGELIAAIVLSNNSATLQQVLTLAFFIPVIIAVGGNVGIQSSAIVVRGLATGEIDFGDIFHRLLKEFKIAVLNGLLMGLVMFVVVRVAWQETTTIALLVASALLTVNLVAGLVGSTIPLILKQFKIDPALASGPFITTSNDIIGLFIYLKMATLVLGHS